MKVVLITTAPGPGGVWRHVRDLADGLHAAGHEVSLALAGRLRAEAADAGYRVLSVRDSTRAPADIWHLHLHDTYDRQALPLLLARRVARGMSVVTEHLPRSNASDPGLGPDVRTRGAAQAKWAFKRAEFLLAGRVIAVSEASKQFLVRRYGIDAGAVSVVRNGVDAGPPPPALAERETVEVVAVGSLNVQKGHDVLIRAAASSSVPWRLTIVGSGRARERLERLAGDLAPGRVTFAGWDVAGAAAPAGADIVAVPSLWESAPYVVLEAAAAGRPVVASAVDGIPELVADEESGVLVEPGDPAVLRAAIDRLASDPGLRARLGSAARERVVRDFTLERMVADTIAVYRG